VRRGLPEITIISGGQTGADRAALDFAIEHGIAHGGWCPRGRLAEDGPIDARYQLRETPSRRYAERTEWNVRDSDATVVFTMGSAVRGGTALTVAMAERLGKPCLHLPSAGSEGTSKQAREFLNFLSEHGVQTLNVAGPRASQEPEIADYVRSLLTDALHMEDSLGSVDD
jgi:predicted Rossmann-fold nucleotide-binding protein